CHNSDMYGFDISNFLVVNNNLQIYNINELSRDVYIECDSINQLKRLHKKLWKFYVLCGKDENNEKDIKLIEKIHTFCTKKFENLQELKLFIKGLKNNNHNFSPNLNSDEQKNRVFISYSRKDSTVANKFYDFLTKKKISAFLDTEKKSGEKWTNEINRNLEVCQILIVLWSTNAHQSDWVDNEITYCQKANKKILFFRLDEFPTKPLYSNIEEIYFEDNNIFWSDIEKKIKDILNF
ncbi:MAG: toll/interleukin-1 receptor domain-containing protein, partial [Saprospiraceae bacterium]|nr:toll/interleukin-1 receptor domain-containing protein [Saprospiraceae bacterium]